jgi:hypothetical protein
MRRRRSKHVRTARQRRRRRKRLELTERPGSRTSSDDDDHRPAFGNRRRRSRSIRQAGSIPKDAGRLARRERRRRTDNLQRKKSGDHEALPSGIVASRAGIPDGRKGAESAYPPARGGLALPRRKTKVIRYHPRLFFCRFWEAGRIRNRAENRARLAIGPVELMASLLITGNRGRS